MTLAYQKDIVGRLRPGDLIKIKRTCFTHWAVFIGDDIVIHVKAPDSLLNASAASGGDLSSIGSILTKTTCRVVKENIYCVAGRDKIELGNDWDATKTPLDAEEILRRAVSKLGSNEYHAIHKNCEHFARWCRYDEEKSDQSGKIVYNVTLGSMLGGFLVAGPFGAAVAGAASLFFTKPEEPKKDPCERVNPYYR
ncbi:unnamed protein product [Lymnaea stagnalis]|uniref:LRAT domain-containing protein n=1 Tax=Lymnaea stagnalis TaxID=6523 RepID=A0AAV2HQL9_LYMST